MPTRFVRGAALELHGSGYRTEDVDLVYARDSANIERLVRAHSRQLHIRNSAATAARFDMDGVTVSMLTLEAERVRNELAP